MISLIFFLKIYLFDLFKRENQTPIAQNGQYDKKLDDAPFVKKKRDNLEILETFQMLRNKEDFKLKKKLESESGFTNNKQTFLNESTIEELPTPSPKAKKNNLVSSISTNIDPFAPFLTNNDPFASFSANIDRFNSFDSANNEQSILDTKDLSSSSDSAETRISNVMPSTTKPYVNVSTDEAICSSNNSCDIQSKNIDETTNNSSKSNKSSSEAEAEDGINLESFFLNLKIKKQETSMYR